MTEGNGDALLTTLRELRARAMLGGGARRIDQQHARGKLTARERLALLVDEGSFQEFGALATHNVVEFGLDQQRFPGDGIVTGFGKINGRRVAVFAQDFTVLGGSFSEVQSQKICRIQDLALESGIPLVGLNDSGGARIQEGVRSLAAYGEVFMRNVMASGVIPQISVILGPCAGGAVYSPALTDFVIMAGGSYMFLTGPDVIKAVTGEDVTAQTLGGAEVHTSRSGVAHLDTADEGSAIEMAKRLLGYLPQNNNEDPPQIQPYDPRGPHGRVAQHAHPATGRRAVRYARCHRVRVRPRELSGNPPELRAPMPSSVRAPGWLLRRRRGESARLHVGRAQHRRERQDRALHPHLRRLQHSAGHLRRLPGFLPGTDQEYGGVIRHGAKIIYAYCESTVPKISVVTRKAMGGAYVAMGSKQMRTDLAFAWPTAQIAVMGAEPRCACSTATR